MGSYAVMFYELCTSHVTGTVKCSVSDLINQSRVVFSWCYINLSLTIPARRKTIASVNSLCICSALETELMVFGIFFQDYNVVGQHLTRISGEK